MSKTTILLAGLMLVGLIASPALAQTTVTFMDQRWPGAQTPDQRVSDFSNATQYALINYWRAYRAHHDAAQAPPDGSGGFSFGGLDPATSPGVANQRGGLLDYYQMFGTDTSTRDVGLDTYYVGQIPHGAVINSAVISFRRYTSSVSIKDVGVHPILDPDKLGHWGVSDPADPSWDNPDGTYTTYDLGAGYQTRNSYPDGDPDVPWTTAGTDYILDVIGPSQTVKNFYNGADGGGAFVYEEWQVDQSIQTWADSLNARQGWVIQGQGTVRPDEQSRAYQPAIFWGRNSLWWSTYPVGHPKEGEDWPTRPIVTISFTPSTLGDADKNLTVDGSDLNLLLTGWSTGDKWQEGDFNGDGNVDGSDLNWLLTNWDYPPPAAASVPEPATLGLLAFGAVALVRRRRRA